jgi:hypothetical protein
MLVVGRLLPVITNVFLLVLTILELILVNDGLWLTVKYVKLQSLLHEEFVISLLVNIIFCLFVCQLGFAGGVRQLICV